VIGGTGTEEKMQAEMEKMNESMKRFEIGWDTFATKWWGRSSERAWKWEREKFNYP